ncbi:MAG: hypothetical protein PHR26_03700 [Candidatus ainarchaeum sp.]|nr:hypothetical protein [Candidatus ainarchaeum sp.]MDD3976312.1 hypothetical protein [Candidatus ainarchaeum sp.]
MNKLPFNNKGYTNILILARKETKLNKKEFILKSMSKFERPLNITILSDPNKIFEYNKKQNAQFYVIDPYFSNYTKLFEIGLQLFSSNKSKILFLDRKNAPQFLENMPNIKPNVESILNGIEKINKIHPEKIKLTSKGYDYITYRITGAIHVTGGFGEKFIEKVKQKKMSGIKLNEDELYLTELYQSKLNYEKILKKSKEDKNYDKKLLNNVMDHYKDVLNKINILNKSLNNPDRRELIAEYHNKYIKFKEQELERTKQELLNKQINKIKKTKLRFFNFKFRHRK